MNPTQPVTDAMNQMGSAAQWSSAGGLEGLVILALFLLIAAIFSATTIINFIADRRRQTAFDNLLHRYQAGQESLQELVKESTAATVKMEETLSTAVGMFDSIRAALSDIAKTTSTHQAG